MTPFFYYFNEFYYFYFLIFKEYMKNYHCDVHIWTPYCANILKWYYHMEGNFYGWSGRKTLVHDSKWQRVVKLEFFHLLFLVCIRFKCPTTNKSSKAPMQAFQLIGSTCIAWMMCQLPPHTCIRIIGFFLLSFWLGLVLPCNWLTFINKQEDKRNAIKVEV